MQVIQLLGGLQGTYQGGSFTAAGGRFSSKIEQVDLVGPIVGLWPKEQVQFKTPRLTWILPTQKVIGPTPVEAIQQTPEGPRRAQGDRLEGDLQTRVLVLRENARLTSTEPHLIITAPQFAWNTVAAIVTSDRPLTIQYLPEQLTLTAQQGVANLRSRSVQLSGDATAIAPQGSLRGDRMTWLQSTGAVEVLGNVVYEQRKPYSRTQGQQAIGNVLTRSVVVQGGRVSSLVIPEPRRSP
jgi:lipopolysaccharide export system protein LptA